MKKQVSVWKEFTKGLWEINPTFKQILGMCPTLAVTVSAINGIAMALATTFVLVFSSFLISCVRKLIPNQVRIASYIVIIATFVTIADLVMKAKFPELSKALGPFVPLIVVNCIILGRAEAFASKNSPIRSVMDALGNGIGFLIALTIMGSIRELLGSRTIFGYQILPNSFEPLLVMILPAGAFITLGLLMGIANAYIERKKKIEHEILINKFRERDSTQINLSHNAELAEE
ncbi:MAG: electron transport complex subunit E [Melioribacteraceae bacterium]